MLSAVSGASKVAVAITRRWVRGALRFYVILCFAQSGGGAKGRAAVLARCDRRCTYVCMIGAPPELTPALGGRRSVAATIQAYTGAVALVAVSTLVGLWLAPRWGTAAVDMIYLPAVLAA